MGFRGYHYYIVCALATLAGQELQR
ncbi:hypothetical protein AFERRI_410011 [Acidithiobacillus ferrivorans]|uniref:Uncharacterized protein n=1 Tax=Acidithiobacillus ferrivorans TaxID=160808 RepID=A0A060UV90_9PROT|nr:hypothetical protein AFERRI_410011 [Acidithiobacillus ferrivorans]